MRKGRSLHSANADSIVKHADNEEILPDAAGIRHYGLAGRN